MFLYAKSIFVTAPSRYQNVQCHLKLRNDAAFVIQGNIFIFLIQFNFLVKSLSYLFSTVHSFFLFFICTFLVDIIVIVLLPGLRPQPFEILPSQVADYFLVRTEQQPNSNPGLLCHSLEGCQWTTTSHNVPLHPSKSHHFPLRTTISHIPVAFILRLSGQGVSAYNIPEREDFSAALQYVYIIICLFLVADTTRSRTYPKHGVDITVPLRLLSY